MAAQGPCTSSEENSKDSFKPSVNDLSWKSDASCKAMGVFVDHVFRKVRDAPHFAPVHEKLMELLDLVRVHPGFNQILDGSWCI